MTHSDASAPPPKKTSPRAPYGAGHGHGHPARPLGAPDGGVQDIGGVWGGCRRGCVSGSPAAIGGGRALPAFPNYKVPPPAAARRPPGAHRGRPRCPPPRPQRGVSLRGRRLPSPAIKGLRIRRRHRSKAQKPARSPEGRQCVSEPAGVGGGPAAPAALCSGDGR